MVRETAKFGINQDRAVRFHSDNKGTSRNYEAINEAMTSLRTTNMIKSNWKSRVEEDFDERK